MHGRIAAPGEDTVIALAPCVAPLAGAHDSSAEPTLLVVALSGLYFVGVQLPGEAANAND